MCCHACVTLNASWDIPLPSQVNVLIFDQVVCRRFHRRHRKRFTQKGACLPPKGLAGCYAITSYARVIHFFIRSLFAARWASIQGGGIFWTARLIRMALEKTTYVIIGDAKVQCERQLYWKSSGRMAGLFIIPVTVTDPGVWEPCQPRPKQAYPKECLFK